MANLPRLRNKLVAEREQLAARERQLGKEIDKLRSEQDDLSNRLHAPNPSLSDIGNMMEEERTQRPIEPAQVAALVIEAGRRARGEVPPPLPKKGSIARLVIDCGRRARGEKVDDPD
jgi:hypothetical protein